MNDYDREAEGAAAELIVGAEHTHSDVAVTMYRHGFSQVAEWVEESGFSMMRDVKFNFFMDMEKKKSLPVRTYLVKLTGKNG